MAGFDWAIHKGDSQAANSDLGIPIFETQEAFILRDRFDLVEGLSGWKHNDVLTGRVVAVNTRAEAEGTAAVPGPDSALETYSNALLEKNVDLITGLRALVAHITRTDPDRERTARLEQVVLETADASDILLGGGGSDTIKGLAGNDVIDGDKWLNVRIRFVEEGVAYTTDEMKGLVYREVDYVNGVPTAAAVAQFGGRSLDELMFDRTVNPGSSRSSARSSMATRPVMSIRRSIRTWSPTTASAPIPTAASSSITRASSKFPGMTMLKRGKERQIPFPTAATPFAASRSCNSTEAPSTSSKAPTPGEVLNGTGQADLLVGKGGRRRPERRRRQRHPDRQARTRLRPRLPLPTTSTGRCPIRTTTERLCLLAAGPKAAVKRPSADRWTSGSAAGAPVRHGNRWR